MKIKRENTEDIYALSSIQENLLFHYVSNPDSDAYLEQIYFELSGNIQVNVIHLACIEVMRRNAALRTVFRWENIDSPVQIVLKEIDERFVYCEDYNAENMNKFIINDIMENDRKDIFFLQDITYRFTLYKLSERRFLFAFTFHHILLDGWSSSTLCHDIFSIYINLMNNQNINYFQRPSYKQYLRINKAKNMETESKRYWKKYLSGVDISSDLFSTDKRISENTGTGYYDIFFHRTQSKQIYSLCKKIGVTFASFVYGAWAILLQRYTNVDDVVFGITVSDRSPMIKDVDKIIGLLINTIPLRVEGKENISVIQLLRRIHKDRTDMFPHQGISLAQIKHCAELPGSMALFHTLVVIDNYPLDKFLKTDDFSILDIYTAEGTEYPVTLQVLPFHDDIKMRLMYQKSIITHSVIQHVAEHLQLIIAEMLNQREKGIFSFNILTQREKNLLSNFNQTAYEYPDYVTIPQLFEKICKEFPNEISITCGENSIDYKELEKRINTLAQHLFRVGVQEKDNIAIAIAPSIEMVIAIMAVLKSGCVCVPLDISYPEMRNEYILNDSGVSLILETSPSINACSHIKRICVNDIPCIEEKNIAYTYSDSNVNAFLLYTSGSTGNPKGVYLHHKGIINHIWIKRDILEISRDDRVACTFSINVVASIWQLLLPLLTGSNLFLYPAELEKDPYSLFQQLAKDEIYVVELIPSQLETYIELLDMGKPRVHLPVLRRIALTSEPVMPRIVNQFYKYYDIVLVNCYGQTECCDDTVHYPIPVRDNIFIIPIGKPSYNTRIYILDKHGNIQPIGVIGELCVAGDSVTAGYKGKDEITKDKFQYNHIEKQGLLYHTGDLAQWTQEGLLICYGRIDRQVKIRGNRIELGDIEECVKLFKGVLAVCVTMREVNGQNLLIAYYIANDVIDEKELNNFLVHRLPRNSIPAIYKRINELPKTPNGKVDIKALPDVNFEKSGKRIKPQNELEEALYHIWCNLLNQDTVPLDENFFDIGGHSLLLIKLQNQINKELDIDITVIELLEYTTIQTLAEYINSGKRANIKLSEKKAEQQKIEKESIAVIGLSGRFPGADNIHDFWENIASGKDCISNFSTEELDDNIKNINNPLYVPGRGILNDIEMFDAAFFDISPREAELMDPQQRKFLECVWEALEDAGYAGETENRIGVYASSGFSTYLVNQIIPAKSNISASEFQVMLGNDKDFLSTKVSYKFNLNGPAFTVQSACSSSFSAIYLACRELQNNGCDIAIAGGSYISVPQKRGYVYELNNNLSSDGLCKTFDLAADGSVMSNGVGVVILKRLTDALKDKDHIYAIIEAVGINNDGNLKASYTAPSVSAQASLIIQTQNDAGITPNDIQYVEAHGTGTDLGDSIELAALHRAFTIDGDWKYNSCALGSLKSVIGHLDVAAGVAGLIKTVLALKHKQIPPSIHFEMPNNNFDFISSPFYVNTHLRPWKTDKVRRAGISSFGIGGTNIHMIVKEASFDEKHEIHRGELIVISARTSGALSKIAGDLSEFISSHKEVTLRDIAYTLQTGRKVFEYRKAFYVKNIQAAAIKLSEITRESRKMKRSAEGSNFLLELYEWDNICTVSDEMYESNEYYRTMLNTCCMHIEEFCGINIKPFLFGKKPNPYKKVCQFIIQYAVLKLIEKVNVYWKDMNGFGFSRYVTDCVRDIISLEDALPALMQESISNENDSELLRKNGFCIKYNVMGSDNLEQIELLADDACLLDEWLFWSIIGVLWECRAIVDLSLLSAFQKGYKISLPTYPFERQRYWIESCKEDNTVSTVMTSNRNNDINCWTYLPIWKQSLIDDFSAEKVLAEKNLDKSRYLIFYDSQNFSSKVVEQLIAEGKQIIRVGTGSEYKNNSHDSYYIRPEEEEDYMRLLADIASNGETIDTILHFWLMRDNEKYNDNISCFHQDKILGFYSLLYLVKALNQNQCDNREIQLYVFNIGTVRIEKSDKLCPEKYLANGLCKVIMQEHPQFICRIIDLAVSYQDIMNGHSNALECVMSELKSPFNDYYVAYRNGIRWLPDYESVCVSNLRQKKDYIENNGVYLITGGLGKIGRTFAKIIAGKATNVHIILLSSRKLPAAETAGNNDIHHFFSELEGLGAQVEFISCDISDCIQVNETFDYIYKKYERLDGIIHLAGITGKNAVSFVMEETMEKCEMQFRPKVYGVYYILSALKEHKPKFMLILSSLCTMLGGIGSATYASANSVLDAIALSEMATFPISTINWEAWQDETLENWYTLNKYAMSEKEASGMFNQLLEHALVPRMIISTGNIIERQKEWFLSKNATGNSVNKPRIAVDNEDYVAPGNAAEELLCEIWEEQLGITPIGVTDNFFECGGHSLIASRITTQIYSIFEVEIPIKSFFVEPTIRNLVNVISELRGGLEVTIQISQLYREVADMSNDEVYAVSN